MKKISSKAILSLMALTLLVSLLSVRLFFVPPMGKLFDPFIGAVQNSDESALYAKKWKMTNMHLKDVVTVYFDNRKVPHIYAKNADDLYFAQGYVTASLRLWQMDFMSYAAAGRLSEIFDEQFFDYDRGQRRMGILKAAKDALKLIESDPQTRAVLNAYTKGVNAYIQQLGYKKMPIEYKLMDYSPESWTNLKTVLIMKYMAATLSGYEEDYSMTGLMLILGEEKFNKLYPEFTAHITPIVPDSLKRADSFTTHIAKPGYLDYSFLSSGSILASNSFNPHLGSNSWVVSGKKTKSGHPILSNDPHLAFSMPAIWVEMQLSAPGINVYGVAIPGTPAVIIGFNENIAWGLTNGEVDVKDWYKLKISDDYKKYKLDDKWVELDAQVEEIKRRGQKPYYDTVYYTLHGPIVGNRGYTPQKELVNFALRWSLHRPSNEFFTFIQLASAKNYNDFTEAVKHYASPVQNFMFASKTNDIAVRHQGSMPIKWTGQGKFVMDGTRSSFLYSRDIPFDSLPQLLNPSCNYVLSANQHPTNSSYPYYYNGHFAETRAKRIRHLLESGEKFDPEKMIEMQLDNVNALAVEVLPGLVRAIRQDSTDPGKMETLESLKNWDGAYNIDDRNSLVFNLWWDKVKQYTWDEMTNYSFRYRFPDDYVLLDMIRSDSTNEYFDILSTQAKENAPDVIQLAFDSAISESRKLKQSGVVRWGEYNRASFLHLARLMPYGRFGIVSGGSPETINATSPTFGPSWRMVVELGDKPVAYGVYAGGQSGNPGSKYYDNFLSDWNHGFYYPLLLFASEEEAAKQSTTTWTLK
jgi:penicillin amidase